MFVMVLVFSLSSVAAIAVVLLMVVVCLGGRGDGGGGMKLVILLSGSLVFEGPKGGFFSVLVFTTSCLADDNAEA